MNFSVSSFLLFTIWIAFSLQSCEKTNAKIWNQQIQDQEHTNPPPFIYVEQQEDDKLEEIEHREALKEQLLFSTDLISLKTYLLQLSVFNPNWSNIHTNQLFHARAPPVFLRLSHFS